MFNCFEGYSRKNKINISNNNGNNSSCNNHNNDCDNKNDRPNSANKYNKSNREINNSQKNIIEIFEKNKIMSNDLNKSIPEFSLLLKSIKDIEEKETKNSKNDKNKNSKKKLNKLFNTLDIIPIAEKVKDKYQSQNTLKALNNIIENEKEDDSKNDSDNDSDIYSKNNDNKDNNITNLSQLIQMATNEYKKNQNNIRHYDKGLEFINEIGNVNEEIKQKTIIRNSKGFFLINKFFNPDNKDIREKNNILNKMLNEFKLEYAEIYSNTDEIKNEYKEMQQRNIDLLNIYNKNCIFLSKLKITKDEIEKKVSGDPLIKKEIEDKEKINKIEKEKNILLKQRLFMEENKFKNIKISQVVFDKLNQIFNNVIYLKGKVKDDFIIKKDIFVVDKICESFSICRTLQFTSDFLLKKFYEYKDNSNKNIKEKFDKLIKLIEFDKKGKELELQRSNKILKQRKLFEDYLDMIVRGDIFSNKRKNFRKNYYEKKEIKKNEVELKEEEENKIYEDFLMSIYYDGNEEQYFI
jgi:hypothetical protein